MTPLMVLQTTLDTLHNQAFLFIVTVVFVALSYNCRPPIWSEIIQHPNQIWRDGSKTFHLFGYNYNLKPIVVETGKLLGAYRNYIVKYELGESKL